MLVIDHVGLIPLRTGAEASWFFEVVNTATTAAAPLSSPPTAACPMGTAFGDTVVAAAILDRLMHNAIVFNIKGPSWRVREHSGLEIAATQPAPERIR